VKDFDFSAPEVLETLRDWKRIRYIGSAISDFQAQPLMPEKWGIPSISSDWEFELHKRITGKHSGILANPSAIEDMPNFHTHMEEYTARSKELGENMFRFSLDFGRLCPSEGEFNSELMARYVRMLALVRANGQEPMLTLYHWPMPMFLLQYDRNEERIEAGGWEHPDVVKHFRFYIDNIVKYLADEDKVRMVLESEKFTKDVQDQFLADDLVKYFLTINEPTNIVIDGYVAGVFPPFKRGKFSLMWKAVEKLVEAHDVAYDALKGGIILPTGDVQVGVAHNWTHFDGMLGDVIQSSINEKITDAFERDGNRTDFVGFQYYCRVTVPSLYQPFGKFRPKGRYYGSHPGHGDVYPEGLYKSLKRLHEMYPRKDIFITEFGFPEGTDKKRPYWILETFRYVLQAKKEDVPIKGMLLWSLVDNFEWERGMEQKFGLFSEEELIRSLTPSLEGKIRSFEVWPVITKVITDPSPQSLNELQLCYRKAQMQFEVNI